MIDTVIEKKLSTGETVKAYPLTQAQSTMLYLFNTLGGGSSVLNIGTGYYRQGDLDVDLFRESIYEAIERCDTMRLRFVEDKQYGMLQYIVPKTEMEIEEVDLSDRPEEEAHNVMKEWTYELIDMYEKPLNTVKIIHLENNRHGLYAKFQHLAFDGYSSKVFLSDVMAIYLSKTAGMPYPKPMKPYLEAVAQELDYLNSPRHRSDRKFFLDLFTKEKVNEPIYNDYLQDNRLYKQRIELNEPNRRFVTINDDEHTESKPLIFEATEEFTNNIMNTCAEKGLSISSVLLAGLRTAFSSINRNEEDVSIKFMIHRRATLLEKKSGGIRFHFFTLRTVIKEDMSFREAIAEIERVQTDLFQHSSFHPLEMYQLKYQILEMGSLAQTYDSTAFSYHPYVETPAASEEERKSSTGIWYNNNVSLQPLYLTVKHRSSDKGFEFIYEYRTYCKPEEDLKILHAKLIKTIELGLADPDMKMKDILNQI